MFWLRVLFPEPPFWPQRQMITTATVSEPLLPSKKEAFLRVQEPARLRAQEPAHLRAQKPARLRAQKPARLRAQKPARLRAQEPAHLRAQKPARLRAQEPARLRAQKPAHLRAQKPAHLDRVLRRLLSTHRTDRACPLSAELFAFGRYSSSPDHSSECRELLTEEERIDLVRDRAPSFFSPSPVVQIWRGLCSHIQSRRSVAKKLCLGW